MTKRKQNEKKRKALEKTIETLSLSVTSYEAKTFVFPAEGDIRNERLKKGEEKIR